MATPRSNSACTLASQVVGKLTLPSFSSCCENAPKLSAAEVRPATNIKHLRFIASSPGKCFQAVTCFAIPQLAPTRPPEAAAVEEASPSARSTVPIVILPFLKLSREESVDNLLDGPDEHSQECALDAARSPPSAMLIAEPRHGLGWFRPEVAARRPDNAGR